MRFVNRFSRALNTSLQGAFLTILATSALVASPAALAQQEVINDYGCGADVSNVGNCTANEVSLSGVTNVTVTDVNDNPLTECVSGQTIKISTLTADLDSNTGTRYDLNFWVGRLGNDPRNAIGEGGCIALSLPDDTGSAFIDDFEGGPDTDNCLDFSQPPAPIQLDFGGGGGTLTCDDSDNDGMADLQVLTTWWQNTNFLCGMGDDVSPYDFTNPHFSPGAPSKCDFTAIPLVPIIMVGQSITKTVTDVGGDGPGGSVDEAGDVISYSLLIENTDTGTLTNVEAGDPLFEGFDQGTDCAPISLPGTLMENESTTCTGTYTAKQSDIDDNGGGDGDIDNIAFTFSDQVGLLNDSAAVPIVQDFSYTIDKVVTDIDSAGDGVINNAGEEIDYEITVTNDGNATLTNVDVTDTLITLNCNPAVPATLAPGESVVCTGTYVVQQGDIDAGGTIDNTATATSNETGPVQDSESVPVSQSFSKSIDKVATDVDGAGDGVINNAGEEIDYTITVTNDGNTTLTGVDVTDTLITLNCNPVVPATLAPGESVVCTGTYVVTQGDIDAGGTIDNTATATSNEASQVQDSESVPVSQSFSKTIDKVATDVDGAGDGVINNAGEEIDYEITVTNDGNTTLTNVDVTDTLITLNCNPVVPATLAPGESVVCTGTYVVTQGDIDAGGTIDNTATATSNEASQVEDSESVPVSQSFSKTIDKVATDVDSAGDGVINNAGEEIDYEITVTNDGNTTLTNVNVTDTLITLNCNPVVPATLAPGESVVCTGTYVVTQGDIDGGGPIMNTATATSNEASQVQDNESVPVAGEASYTIDKVATDVDSAGNGVIDNAGEEIDYEITVTNNGSVSLDNVNVTDDLITLACNPAVPVGTLAPAASIVCTGTYVVQQADIDGGGPIMNTATATSDDLEDITDTENVPVSQSESYTIDKVATDVDSAGNGVIDNAGEEIDYEITVTNDGNTTLTNVNVTDDLITLVCNPAVPTDLAPAASIVCTGTYVVQQGDIDDGGPITNTATASSNELENITDTENVPVSQSESYTIDKVATDVDGAGNGVIDNAGEEIDYEITVTNNGNTLLTNVNVTDNLITLVCNPAVPTDLAPAASIVCTGTYVVTQGDIDGGGPIMNTGTAESEELGDITDDETVPVSQTPALTVDKTSGTTLITEVDQIVDYSFVITNIGNITAVNVSLTDFNLDVVANCAPAQGSDLAPAEVMNCAGQHTVTLADLQGSTLDNTATANSDTTPPVEDDHSIPVNPPVPPPVFLEVPVDGKWALMLLILATLAVGWRFAPVQRRR